MYFFNSFVKRLDKSVLTYHVLCSWRKEQEIQQVLKQWIVRWKQSLMFMKKIRSNSHKPCRTDMLMWLLKTILITIITTQWRRATGDYLKLQNDVNYLMMKMNTFENKLDMLLTHLTNGNLNKFNIPAEQNFKAMRLMIRTM